MRWGGNIAVICKKSNCIAENDNNKETFEEFRKSFFYGARSDMSFKFLDHLTDEAAGQTAAHAHQSGFEYDNGPFTPFPISPDKAKITLLRSSGHYPCDKDPKPLGFDKMNQLEAEQKIMSFLKEKPELTEIPFSISANNFCVRHGGYDASAAKQDSQYHFSLATAVRILRMSIRNEETIGMKFRTLSKP